MIKEYSLLERALNLSEVAALSHGRFTVDVSSNIFIDKNIKFKVPYVSVLVSGSKVLRLKYLEERWKWFNTEIFGNDMTMPVLTIEEHKGSLGTWFGGQRRLNLSPMLFKIKTDAQILGTLVHEMAHQYDKEILNSPFDYTTLGHGPEWKDIMRKVGLPPDVTFTGDQISLKSEKEKEVIQLKKLGQNTEDTSSKLLSEDYLKDKEFVYSYYMDAKDKLVPIVVFNIRSRYHKNIPNMFFHLTKKDILKGQFPYSVNIRRCKRLSQGEVAAFPSFFKTFETLKIINEYIKTLKMLGPN